MYTQSSMKTPLLGTILAVCLVACGQEPSYDASGTFEAVETLVSAETAGIIRVFRAEEGQTLTAGQTIGYIDTTQLYLRKKQLLAQVSAVLSKRPDVASSIASLQEELRHAKSEQQRVANLLKADAATPRQMDDATAQVNVLHKRIAAEQTSLGITANGLKEDTSPLLAQIEQVNDDLGKSIIRSPINGTVLSKYAEPEEMATVAKPLFKIANLDTIILRAYITGDQFAAVKLSQRVRVLVDNGQGKYREYPGTVGWISDKAEFTPKTIQTKDERANLVYASKIRVKNDGFLKIGMYGEVVFNEQRQDE